MLVARDPRLWAEMPLPFFDGGASFPSKRPEDKGGNAGNPLPGNSSLAARTMRTACKDPVNEVQNPEKVSLNKPHIPKRWGTLPSAATCPRGGRRHRHHPHHPWCCRWSNARSKPLHPSPPPLNCLGRHGHLRRSRGHRHHRGTAVLGHWHTSTSSSRVQGGIPKRCPAQPSESPKSLHPWRKILSRRDRKLWRQSLPGLPSLPSSLRTTRHSNPRSAALLLDTWV